MISERDFGRLEGKVDSINNRLDLFERLETRVRDNETAIAHSRGRQSVVSTAISSSVSLFISLIVAFASRQWA